MSSNQVLGETSIFSGEPITFKKCTYQGHIATIWSVEHASEYIDIIGKLLDLILHQNSPGVGFYRTK